MARRFALLAAALVLVPSFALAQPYGYGFAPNGQDLVRREIGQTERIAEGERWGRITRFEARELRRRQSEIRFGIAYARADGFVSPRERDRIDRLMDEQDRRILHELRDRDRRWPARY